MRSSESIYQAVLERYVGRQPGIIKGEQELYKIKKKVVEGQYSILHSKKKGTLAAEDINDSKENKALEKHLKDTFKVKEMRIVWLYTAVPNAFTPVKSFPMFDKGYGIDSKGVDYNKKLSVSVFVHTGLFTHIGLDEEEVMAIILHEIGHNFYQSLFHTLSRINPYSILAPGLLNEDTPIFQGIVNALTMGAMDFTDMGGLYKSLFQMKDNIIDKLGFRKLFMSFSEFSIVIGALTPSMLLTFVKLLKGKARLRWEMIDPFDVAATYSVEKHADSFAVDYGYGTALASGLNKMDQRVNSFKYDIPIIGWMYDFEALVTDITFQTFTGYPTIHNRQQSALKRLKESSKDPNIPRDIRIQLEKDIKEFEEYYDNYMSIGNDENKKRVFTWIYRKFIIDGLFRGNADLREFLYKMDQTHAKKDTWAASKNVKPKK